MSDLSSPCLGSAMNTWLLLPETLDAIGAPKGSNFINLDNGHGFNYTSNEPFVGPRSVEPARAIARGGPRGVARRLRAVRDGSSGAAGGGPTAAVSTAGGLAARRAAPGVACGNCARRHGQIARCSGCTTWRDVARRVGGWCCVRAAPATASSPVQQLSVS